jgi:hypothetical protein
MSERRGAPRVKLTWTMRAKVKAYIPARVLDVSSSGVLLELDHPLPPRTACTVKITCDEEEILLPACIRRCFVGGHGTNEKGEKVVFYHAGLAFENADPSAVTRLGEHLSLPGALPEDSAEDQALANGREALALVAPTEAPPIIIDIDVESD